MMSKYVYSMMEIQIIIQNTLQQYLNQGFHHLGKGIHYDLGLLASELDMSRRTWSQVWSNHDDNTMWVSDQQSERADDKILVVHKFRSWVLWVETA